MSAVSGALPAASAEPLAVPLADTPPAALRRLASRIATLCWVEMRKIRHDRTGRRRYEPATHHEVIGHGRGLQRPPGTPAA